ncbi:hypothetical protein BVH74_16265 [Halopseudomonas phragmitis]|uniref:Sel1 repeat family protein n=2 Tax=Halopseudomonas phragmitis TaxID=1931241 RepID=A0A1V0B8I3_9GAMM|nr:hypothetical protein BVH74_16265 [Halopseudomonas phragmitis]
MLLPLAVCSIDALARTRREFMRTYSVLLLSALALALAGCESLPDRQDTDDRSGAWWSNTDRLLRLLNDDPQPEKARQAEVEALFAQPYIDPLTRYLETHAQDEDYAAQHQRVSNERDRRCAEVAAIYRQRPANQDNLNRYRQGYQYSCPEDVKQFASRVAQQRPSPATVQPQVEAGPSPSRQQANDCYLLFTIRNLQQARQSCQAPAEQGDAQAQHHLASLHHTANEHASAFDWAQRSAAQGYAPGQLLLGQLYQQGLGVEQDERQALAWLERAANQRLAEARHVLALAYRQGQGTAPDPDKAQRLLTLAANQDYLPAQLLLAELYQTGELAGPGKSRQWLERAANQGSAEAQYRLGNSYAQGIDGPRDNQEAYVWYSLALLNGEQRARPRVEQLTGQLNQEQLRLAQARIQATLNGRRP